MYNDRTVVARYLFIFGVLHFCLFHMVPSKIRPCYLSPAEANYKDKRNVIITIIFT